MSRLPGTITAPQLGAASWLPALSCAGYRTSIVEVNVETALAIGAAGWGILMALSPVLQIRRIVERRSSEDVSIGYFAVLIVGFVLWLSYGLSIDNMTLVIPNSVAFLVSVMTVVVAIRFRPKDGDRPAHDR